ncbi:ATP-dependent RNA helicase like [Actinidia chinensis var. chinensis]|uniref:ATP-dependent RNA helicase like n=1 Tax=Actinidia chinensis var. chinensis TaxID=1590841 RepID=A0A2R6R5J8_ACTCC|nr:ATP-dependent RNA helicase like [Actinidia chinensis var. chinensis]
MATDVLETSSPTSQAPSHYSPLRHFYLAVDRLQFKMETLVDLLGMAGHRPRLPMVVCCSTRDELDAVCSAVSNLSYISIASLYSDLAEAERALILEKFRQATMRWNQIASLQSGDDSEIEKEEQKSHLIVISDACLPLLASGESPVAARVLINYELPAKKETYMRRMATCLAADGIVINMVVGGEVVTLKSIEEGSSLVIAEMPINKDEDGKMVFKHIQIFHLYFPLRSKHSLKK